MARMMSTNSSDEVTRDLLLEEASFLTRSLYRICLRSVNVIRFGNDFDEKDFQRRDEEFSNPRPGVISMSPPPNREDELRSRAECKDFSVCAVHLRVKLAHHFLTKNKSFAVFYSRLSIICQRILYSRIRLFRQ
jgi:hypothetical protein